MRTLPRHLLAAAVALTASAGVAAARPAAPDDPVVARLVARALAGNRQVRAAELELAAATLAPADARAARLPTVELDARATRVLGHQLDLGELVNPAYGALNQLLGQERFPTDVEAKLPRGFDARLRVSAPLWAPAIRWSERLARLGVDARRHGRALTRREVAAGVRTAYLAHTRAALVARRLRESRPLLEENLRVSRALVKADRGFPDAVHRAEAELAGFDQQVREVERAQAAAARALAVLVGGALEQPLPVPDELVVPAAVPVAADEVVAHARRARRELALAELEVARASAERGLARAGYLPVLGAAVDLGAQADTPWDVRDDDLYAAVSVTATWNLFDGGRDRRAARRAELASSQASVRRAELADRVEAEVRDAHDAARVALAGVAAAATREQSAQSAYDLVAARYREGDVPPIDLIAAQTALVTARTDRVVASADYHLRMVELVRVGALDEETP